MMLSVYTTSAKSREAEPLPRNENEIWVKRTCAEPLFSYEHGRKTMAATEMRRAKADR